MARIADLSAMYPIRGDLEDRLYPSRMDRRGRPLLVESPDFDRPPTVIKTLEVTVYSVEGYCIPVTDKFIELEPEDGALAGLAIVDGSWGAYKISGVSVPFNRVSNTTPFVVGVPKLVVHTPLNGRYYANFFNGSMAEWIVAQAMQRGFYPSSEGPLEMPASFALPTQSQKELVSDSATWLKENIEDLVLRKPKRHGNIKETDLRCVPQPFVRVCEPPVKPWVRDVRLAYAVDKGYHEVKRLDR